MPSKLTIAVYCASSAKVDFDYLEAARTLGEIFAKEQVHCVYGAGHVGLMGEMADAILQNQGEITGVIPQFMIDNNWHHKKLEKIIVTASMHERKATMAAMADAAVALPGGCGTLEELLEVITWKQLSLFPKPVIIVNIKGYFDPLIAMLEKAIDQHFMRPEHAELWTVVETPNQILEAIRLAPKTDQNGYNFAVV